MFNELILKKRHLNLYSIKDFFALYKNHIFWVIGVIVTVIILRWLTNILHKWLLKKEKEKYPSETPTSVNLVKRVLNALWLVLGIIALSFIAVGKEKHKILWQNFELVLYVGIVAVITIIAAATTNMWFKHSIQQKIDNKYDPTSFKFLRKVAVAAVYFAGVILAFLAFPSLRGVAQTALGGAGVLALVIGVASQEALSNLVGGLFIVSFKPFKIGDVIKVSDTMVGTVTDITLRHCVIRNFENKMIIIPNAVINKEKLINYDLGELKCCQFIEMGISYDSNVKLAKKIMQEECEKHPLIYDNRSEQDKKDGKPIVKTALTKINESTLNIRAWAWCRSFSDSFQLQCDVNETIKERFDEVGIDLAYPYRNVVLKTESNKPVNVTVNQNINE